MQVHKQEVYGQVFFGLIYVREWRKLGWGWEKINCNVDARASKDHTHRAVELLWLFRITPDLSKRAKPLYHNFD